MTPEVVRIDIALIPSDPQFSKIIEASQTVTKQFENFNIIDTTNFPPHISLLISKIPKGKVELLIESLADIPGNIIKKPPLIPSQIEMGSKGYLSLAIEISPELRALHEWIIEVVAKFRNDIEEDEPHWLRDLSEKDQANLRKYGNRYVLEKFSAHFSIAKVDLQNQRAAYDIVRQIIKDLPTAAAKSLMICDIGMRNEKWDVLYTA